MSNNSSSLYKLIAYALQKKFTGRISLIASNNIQWQFYFFVGKLTWIEGGTHPNRIWLRHVIQYFSEVDVDAIKFKVDEKYQCYQYHTLRILQHKKLIDSEQLQKMLFSRTKEIFGDIFDRENQKQLEIKIAPMTPQQLVSIGFHPSIVIADLKEIFQESQKDYLNFIKQGGVNFSFCYAPYVADKEALRHEVPSHLYDNFVQYFDGKNTLKSIAFKLDKDVIELALLIIPCLKKKIIKLTQIEDLAPYLTIDQYFSETQNTKKKNQPIAVKNSTIVCIDDSPLICKMMNTIVSKSGYQFIGINEPLKAIPLLIQTKPSLIFIDLAMPIINGYELCNQIKKVSQLKETPLVMLTGRDFMAERVKAKVMGISDFIGKPIIEDKIVNAIDKYAK